MVTKEEIDILGQLANSLEKAEEKLETAYLGRKYDEFDNLKRLIFQIQYKILEVIKQ
mgnify:CR=1 FL=1